MKTYSLKVSFIILILAAAWTAGCSQKPAMVLSDNGNGTVVTVRADQVIELRLKGQLGTGYSWKWVADTEFFEEACRQEIITEKTEKTGGGDIQIFRFRALKAGDSGLRFIYNKSWEPDKKPAREYFVRVTVLP